MDVTRMLNHANPETLLNKGIHQQRAPQDYKKIPMPNIAFILVYCLVAYYLCGNKAQAAVLPEERADIGYHVYTGDDVDINVPTILVRKNFKDKVSVSAEYLVDLVSGASIDVRSRASEYDEKRTQTSINVDYLSNRTMLNAGYSTTTENDYEGSTVSLGLSQDFFGDMSTLSMGFSFGEFDVTRSDSENFAETKDSKKYSLSFSQILTKSWITSFTVESAIDQGFLNNPYREVRFVDTNFSLGYDFESERYPSTRNSDAFALRSMYYLPYRASIKTEIRYFSDSWGIKGLNYEVSYAHPFKNTPWLVEVKYRHYSQNEATFYSDLFDCEGPATRRCVNSNTFLARDKELSAFNHQALGIGVSYTTTKPWVSWAKKSSANLYWDFMQFDYDNFSDLDKGRQNSTIAGEEDTFNFDAQLIRLFFSVWY